jgi:hypothetical protein
MNNQVMIYEVKEDAAPNAALLFSQDEKKFFWNDLKFNKLNQGDIVFVVNTYNNYVLFSVFNESRINTEIDSKNLIRRFTYENQIIEPKAPSEKKLKEWQNFICLEITEKKNLSKDWSWITLGSAENSYLSEEVVDRNRIKRIAKLIELFDDNNIVRDILTKNYLLQFRIESFKQLNSFKSCQTSDDFYFLKAQETLDEFKRFNLDPAKYELVTDSFKNRLTIEDKKLRYHQVVESFEDEELKQFGICLGKLVTYLDTKGDHKHVCY